MQGFSAPLDTERSTRQVAQRREVIDQTICRFSHKRHSGYIRDTRQTRAAVSWSSPSSIPPETNAAVAEGTLSLSTVVLPQISPQLSPLEGWCARELEEHYQRAVSLKCPFMKRRLVDALDAADMVLRFLVVRHKSLDIFGPPPGHRSKFQTEEKCRHLSINEIMECIRQDWKEETAKGYYITGNLNSTIYRDDCLFDGPDPDMPVQGLRKYVNAASQLFDRSKSRAELLSLKLLQEHTGESKIVAHWRMKGVLRLPWKPNLPEWTGSTTYHLDEDGLVYLHEENWDMSVLEAFMKTFVPELSDKIWALPYEG